MSRKRGARLWDIEMSSGGKGDGGGDSPASSRYAWGKPMSRKGGPKLWDIARRAFTVCEAYSMKRNARKESCIYGV